MPSHALITTIVTGLGLAFVLGAIANRFKISPLVGYLLAGIVVGPYTPGFVADQALVLQLAEIGIILLMFGVGMHFSVADLLAVRAVAVPVALAQLAAATLLGMLAAWVLGWPVASGVVFGLALSVASTVVLLHALQDRRLVETDAGRIAVGCSIVQDLAMVLVLVLLPTLASLANGGVAEPAGRPASFEFGEALIRALGITVGKAVLFVALMLVVGRRVVPWLLHYIALRGSRELFRLAVLAIALGIAYGASELFGVSFALGAFFAGMTLSESKLSQRAGEESLPLREAFAVLFFVSVGMLFDPEILLRETGPVLCALAIIILAKSAGALLTMRALRQKLATAFTVSASLAQIGEFSFVLAALAIELKLLSPQGQELILAGALISILLNPLLFATLDRLGPWLERRGIGTAAEPSLTATVAEPLPVTQLTNHTVIVGHGRVGSLVAEGVRNAQLPVLVIEEQHDRAEQARALGLEVIFGNAAEPEIIRAANLAEAQSLIVAIPNTFEAGQIVVQARTAHPGIEIIARAHFDDEVEHLRQQGANLIIMGEREIARGMLERVLQKPFAGAPRHDPPPAGPLDPPRPESEPSKS